VNKYLYDVVLNSTGAELAVRGEVIQSLWSGYGEIVRLLLEGAAVPSVVLKYVSLPDEIDHPRGWNTDRSHQRKVTSYAVEMAWYKDWSSRCGDACKVPHCYAAVTDGQECLMVLEDLDDAGFPLRKSTLSRAEIQLCLHWLASFHATFMGEPPVDLWPVGSYWHLATRPDELAAMEEGPLKQAAGAIDARLNNCRYQSLVHGDAKVANFCFSEDGNRVAAVDFQYVGGGCGMKDVAYFLGSCLEEDQLEVSEAELLDYYFNVLRVSLQGQNKEINWPELEQEWRSLFPLAWADFHRFLLGWMPGHWKVNNYSRRITTEVLDQLNNPAD